MQQSNYIWLLIEVWPTMWCEELDLWNLILATELVCLIIYLMLLFFCKFFWLYRFEYPQPTFQKLMKEQCMEPFFVFQVDSILSKRFCVNFNCPPFSFSLPPSTPICFERHLLFLTRLYHFYLPTGFLCGTMVFGWVLVLQPVYSVYAVYVWVNNGKKSVKDLKWVKACQSGYSDLNGASVWKVCHFYYFDYFSFSLATPVLHM